MRLALDKINYYMFKKIFHSTIILLAFSSLSVNAQNICLGTDATLCIGSTATIEDCNPGGANPGANVVLMTAASASYNLSDDSYTGVVNIGFPFTFYGNVYNQCVIGSNGVVTFNLAKANGYCPWSLVGVAPLPSAGFNDALNAMMPAYHDMLPNGGPSGEIRSETIGIAPNRRFVVLWKDMIAFGAQQGECTYMGLIMNENDNSFEFHIGNKPTVAWNNGLAIQGSQNAPGTIAHITPGRNNQVWVAFQEAKKWNPVGGNTNNYTIDPIPYLTILSPNSTVVWANTANAITAPYNAGIYNVNPVLAGTTGYYLAAAGTGCGPAGGTSDTTWITGVSSSVTANGIDDICSSGIGEATATPTSGMAPYVFNWPSIPANTQTVTGLVAGTYTVNMTDGMGCMSSTNVTIGDTPAAFQGNTTIVSCPGGNDGTAFAEMVPPLGNITYLWNDPAGQTTQTAVGLAAGQYTCTITSDIGCAGVVVVDVTEIPGMIGNIVNQTDVTCNSGNDGMIQVNVVQGTGPYSYSWDNSTSTSNIANDLAVGPHTVTVTDANGCIITISGVLNEPMSLNISSLTPNTQICPEDNIDLTVAGTGGSSPYTFTWFQDGVIIGTGTTINVDPDVTNTQYCVELSEACGSPTDQECMLLYFPTPIEPRAEPFEASLCVPDTFKFYNTSVNGGEIASTFWEFGDNITHTILEVGADSTSHYYTAPGEYDIILTTTSIFGCVYINSCLVV